MFQADDSFVKAGFLWSIHVLRLAPAGLRGPFSWSTRTGVEHTDQPSKTLKNHRTPAT